MRGALTAVLLAVISYGLSADAIAFLAGNVEYHCSCPIKGPCCKGAVCKMEVARRRAAGVALHPCGSRTDSQLPLLVRPPALLPEPALLPPAMVTAVAYAGGGAGPARGFLQVPEQPPRRSFSPFA